MRFSYARLIKGSVAIFCILNGISMKSALADQPAAANDGNSEGLTEIVVTAQRREESAQSVPISITQYSAGQLTALGIQSTADLPLAVPGFTVFPTGSGVGYYLRGVGTNQNFPTVENETATYVDGVYMPFSSGSLQQFNNIASIEIDKGPQGTLLGRNATGGAVQINTRDPSSKPAADVELGYGNYNTTLGSFYGTTGVVPNLATDLAVIFNHHPSGSNRVHRNFRCEGF